MPHFLVLQWIFSKKMKFLLFKMSSYNFSFVDCRICVWASRMAYQAGEVGNAGDAGSIPGLGRSPGGENDNPIHHSCLENSTKRGAWLPIAHGVTKRHTQLSDWACTQIYMYINLYMQTFIRNVSYYQSFNKNLVIEHTKFSEIHIILDQQKIQVSLEKMVE